MFCAFTLVYSAARVQCPVWLFSVVPWFLCLPSMLRKLDIIIIIVIYYYISFSKDVLGSRFSLN